MKYLGEADYTHGSPARVGVLVTNLGTPDAPTPKALRRYLKQFLWDPRVVEVPRPLWWLILNGVILNIRPRRSARKYASVWTQEGSPLLVIAQRQAEGIRRRLAQLEAEQIPVAVGMRYGNPSIPDALNELRAENVRKVLVLPLYPQYSASTTASTLDAVSEELRRWRWAPDLHFLSGYEREAGYINALAASVQEHWDQHGRAERLIMSFHGVPRRYLLAGDPYHCFCHATGHALAQALGLEDGRWQVSFQSRFGREEWLRPYTDETLAALPAQGVKSVEVICPGFSADCLETLEEIGDENREIFLDAGGEHFAYIPALNDRPDHLDFLSDLILRNLRPWLDTLDNDRERLADARQRALELGAPR
ncbi:Ferrochelatase, protoheme ferro-lyase [Thioalkalivibrio nitratireducens DSM 14787]|uniref:Ferrochelatase n=1 Tax=Thioalkalivibrio nitratireducens (strain DSM 14787 / UNIQEM 213 / ALEN2) TaxID=1255043 RepID=L0E1K4_THIND|nr:ferrochelatase [Thioalkalivibrio nitratireducens]AGA35178.1 Ferrochelatase, protoheme ferro-lyase [Thioalkalivibrio nitratireducens DSM 14787]